MSTVALRKEVPAMDYVVTVGQPDIDIDVITEVMAAAGPVQALLLKLEAIIRQESFMDNKSDCQTKSLLVSFIIRIAYEDKNLFAFSFKTALYPPACFRHYKVANYKIIVSYEDGHCVPFSLSQVGGPVKALLAQLASIIRNTISEHNLNPSKALPAFTITVAESKHAATQFALMHLWDCKFEVF